MIPLKLNYEYTVKDDLRIKFSSENYGVKIIGVDENFVRIDISADVHYTDWEANDLSKIVSCEYSKEQNLLTIKTNEEYDIRKIKIELKVPKKTLVDMKTENAPISIQQLIGDHSITNENGPIKIMENIGKLKLVSENGPIIMMQCDGDVDLQFENGPLIVKEYAGKFNVKTENSPIKFNKCKGALKLVSQNSSIRILKAGFDVASIQNENGMIYYEFQDVKEGKFDFKNETGRIHLAIPDDMPYKIEALNQMGRFHIGLGEDFEGINGVNAGTKKTVNISRGAGLVKIKVENTMGSISLVKPGSKERKFDFNFLDKILVKTFSATLARLPDDADKEKIRIKLEKARKKISKIKIPNIEINMENIMEDVQGEIKNALNSFDGDKLKMKAEQTINEGFSKVMNKYQEKFQDNELSEQEKEMVDERSRLKILKMLQNGKITADEAEQLINALEGK